METVTISKKEYSRLKASHERLQALSNIKPRRNGSGTKHTTVKDLVGILKNVPMFKGKSSVEVQKMIPEIWSRKYQKPRS